MKSNLKKEYDNAIDQLQDIEERYSKLLTLKVSSSDSLDKRIARMDDHVLSAMVKDMESELKEKIAEGLENVTDVDLYMFAGLLQEYCRRAHAMIDKSEALMRKSEALAQQIEELREKKRH